MHAMQTPSRFLSCSSAGLLGRRLSRPCPLRGHRRCVCRSTRPSRWRTRHRHRLRRCRPRLCRWRQGSRPRAHRPWLQETFHRPVLPRLQQGHCLAPLPLARPVPGLVATLATTRSQVTARHPVSCHEALACRSDSRLLMLTCRAVWRASSARAWRRSVAIGLSRVTRCANSTSHFAASARLGMVWLWRRCQKMWFLSCPLCIKQSKPERSTAVARRASACLVTLGHLCPEPRNAPCVRQRPRTWLEMAFVGLASLLASALSA